MQPCTTIHHAAPGARRVDDTMRGERGQIDRTPVIEADVPITTGVVGPERTRATQDDGHGAAHRRELVHERRDGSGKVVHPTLVEPGNADRTILIFDSGWSGNRSS